MCSQAANCDNALDSFFESIESLIDSIELFKISPLNFINTYCNSLRNQIKNEFEKVLQLEMPKNVDILNRDKNVLLSEVDTFENDCRKVYDIASNHRDYKFRSEMSDKLNEFIKTSRTELKMLHKNYVSNDQWFSIENRMMEERRKKLEHNVLDELQMIKKFIFMNKYYFFKEIRHVEDDILIRFGVLIYINEIFNEKILNYLQ